MTQRTVYMSLGSNVGERERQLLRAVRSLIDVHPHPGKRVPLVTNMRRSRLYETAPVGIADQSPFINTVIEGETTHSPEDLLAAVKHIEQELGRKVGERWGPREIDIDLLYLDGVETGGDPTLPHPRMHERAFVLAPLHELAPELVHPPTRKTLSELLRQVGSEGVRLADNQWDVIRPPDDTRTVIPTVSHARDLAPGMLAEAFASCGALRIETVIEPERIGTLHQLAKEAFNASEAVKELCRRQGGGSGYTPAAVERVIGHGPDPMRHFWDLCPTLAEPPEPVRAFYECATSVWLELTEVAQMIAKAFDQAYRTQIVPSLIAGQHLLRTSQYLNERVSELDVLFPSHADFGLMTLYLGGSSGGLELKIDGVWREAWNPLSSVIVGAGTTLALYAPGKVRPLRHRVVGGSLGRVSSVFFIEPHVATLLPSGVTWRERLDGLMHQVRAER